MTGIKTMAPRRDHQMRLIDRIVRVLASGAVSWLTWAFTPGVAASGDIHDCTATARHFSREWANTDFSRCVIDPMEVISGGPGKDGIPAIDRPQFVTVSTADLDPREPVISVSIGNKTRAYPLRVLIWHEIVNDTLAGIPFAVTYCPLCNAAITFDRRIGDHVLDFGTTGNLRHSDLVMYDRQSESWWQQYTGRGLFGRFAGNELSILPSGIEPFGEFANAYPDGLVLVPNDPHFRDYGSNPYVGYDSSAVPFLYRGEVPEGIGPLERVVVVEDQAWALAFLRTRKEIREGDLLLTWRPGQASALDTEDITQGREVGTVTAQRTIPNGALEDVVYQVTFAFVFHAFNPDQAITLE